MVKYRCFGIFWFSSSFRDFSMGLTGKILFDKITISCVAEMVRNRICKYLFGQASFAGFEVTTYIFL